MEFTAVLERNPETGMWIIEVPGVPGGYSQGASKEEAVGNIREVLLLLQQDGALPAPPAVELARVTIDA